MKLLVFGGTFDPPHAGHVSILRNAIECVAPDKALVIPAGTPPHKAGHFSPPALRLAMCRCFLAVSPVVAVSDMEIRRGGASYTYETLRVLKAQYPGAELYLCVGSDMLLTFEGWRNWRELLAEATLVVQNRADADIAPAEAMAERLRAEGGKVVFASGVVRPVSSTALRAAIRAGDDVGGLIPPAALAVVRQNRLYQKGEASDD